MPYSCDKIRAQSQLQQLIMEDAINIGHYVSVVTHLTFRACQIAKECAQNPELKKYEKGINDPVTEADYKIQTMLIRGIRHFFPNLKIVGEQTTEYPGSIDLDLTTISLDNFPPEFQQNQAVPLSQLCVWIDPIDNTKGFINGTLDCVTILIGLSRNRGAFLGVVGLPYQRQNEKPSFSPEVLVGSVSNKKAYSSHAPNQWSQIQLPKANNPLVFSISDSRGFSSTVQQILKRHSAKLVRVGGSGKKIVQVIKGETDGTLYLKAANHKWDSCAGEAILVAIGGSFSDAEGNPIPYDPEEKSTVNELGNICFADSELHRTIIGQLVALNAKI